MSTQAEAGPSSPTQQMSERRTDESLTPNVPDIEKGKAKTNTKSKTKTNPQAKARAPAPARSKPIPKPIEAFENPDVGEEETVHEVYERIAPHFSQTRYKVGPPPSHSAAAFVYAIKSHQSLASDI